RNDKGGRVESCIVVEGETQADGDARRVGAIGDVAITADLPDERRDDGETEPHAGHLAGEVALALVIGQPNAAELFRREVNGIVLDGHADAIPSQRRAYGE